MIFFSVVLGWLHVMFAISAVGAGLFNILAVVPTLKTLDPPTAGKISAMLSKKLMHVIWASLIGLIVTGVLRVFADGRTDAFGFDTNYGVIFNIKMLLVLIILFNAILITKTAGKIPTSEPSERPALQKRIFTLSVINNAVAIIVVFLAVGLRYGSIL